MLRLRTTTDIDRAASELRARARDLTNFLPTADLLQLRRKYVAWVSTVERQLIALFDDPETWVGLRSVTYWSIADPTAVHLRPEELIRDEGEYQASRLDDLAQRLDHLPRHLLDRSSLVAVLDTNVLLHFLPPAQVKWTEIVGEPPIHLVIPLRVIEELDEKKYTARSNLADRSRDLLSQLRCQLASTNGPADLDETTTIEVLTDDGPRRRSHDADQEILDACKLLHAIGSPIALVTGDTGMTIRAHGLGIEVVEMPSKYLRVAQSTADPLTVGTDVPS
jgi:hypothetical protein